MEHGQIINPHLMFTGVFIPNWLLLRSEISSSSKFVYAMLCWCANKKTGAAFPSQETIATALGISERTVRYALVELVKNELLTQQQVGKRVTNRYFFLWHRWMNGENEVTGNFCRPPKVTGKPASSDRQNDVRNKRKVAGPILQKENKILKGAGAGGIEPPPARRPEPTSHGSEAIQVGQLGSIALMLEGKIPWPEEVLNRNSSK